MTMSLSMQGVRGGVGSTSLVAALGLALHAQQQRVLMVDACAQNLLGLHCGLSAEEGNGWAQAWLDGQAPWQAGWVLDEGLVLLPHGALEPAAGIELAHRLGSQPAAWMAWMEPLLRRFDWLLVDLPAQRSVGEVPIASLPACRIPLRVANVDPACHVLLGRQARSERRPVLVNRYDPAVALQRDLMQVWWHDHQDVLVPLPVHEDVAVPQALACKMPLGMQPDPGVAAHDVAGLALWCLAEAGRLGVPGAAR